MTTTESQPVAPAAPPHDSWKNCPECTRRIRSDAVMCSACGWDSGQPTDDPDVLEYRRGKRNALIGRVAFGAIFFVAYVAVGWALLFVLQSFSQDSQARTANGFVVLASRDPHIAAIGFVWQPLHSILQIPLMLVPGMARDGLAGVVISAAGGVFMLFAFAAALSNLGVAFWWRWTAAVLFGLLPLTVLYGANGMSETLFIGFVIWQLHFLLQWRQVDKMRYLLLAGLAAGAAFWVRYEALPILVATTAWVYLTENPRTFRRLTGVTLAYLAPAAYSVALWLLLNYQFAGNPLFFLRGEYSNQALTALTASQGNLITQEQALLTIGIIALGLSPLLVLALPAAALGVLYGNVKAPLLYAMVIVSILAFQVYLGLSGQSFLFVRFFILLVPLGALLVASLMRGYPRLAGAGAIASLALSGAGAIVAVLLTMPATSQERSLIDWVVEGKAISNQYVGEQQLAVVIGERQGLTLIDSYRGYTTIIDTPDSRRLVVTSDRDFPLELGRLGRVDSIVDYVAVWNPEAGGVVKESVPGAYPDLYAKGADWAELVHQSDGQHGWKLYRINRILPLPE